MDTFIMAPTAAASEVEKRVIQLCEEFKQGINYQIIQNDMPELKQEQVVDVINKLLANSRIDMLKRDDGALVFKLRDPGSLHRIKGAEPEEQVVYKIIEEHGTQGIWAREIRSKSNLHLNTVEKVLRKLESKKLIKSFNSVAAPKKKTYLLYELEPDRSLTGGAWYSDQHFDSEFVDILNQQCWRYLEQRMVRARQVTGGPIAVRNASFASSKEILKHISELGITKVQLSIEDIETILETLVFDGKVERSVAADGPQGVKLYRAVTSFMPTPSLMTIPCGVCPLIKECNDVGDVTPIKCHYMKQWLSLEWGFPHRGGGRGGGGGYGGLPSPAREPFPPFPPTAMNVDMGVEGVWAMRGSNNPGNMHGGPPLSAHPFSPGPRMPVNHPQPPPYGDKETHVHSREVTMEALQQVMSAGGQQVRVTGQQLEVVTIQKADQVEVDAMLRGTALSDSASATPQVEEEVNGTAVVISEAERIDSSANLKDASPPSSSSSSLPLSEADNNNLQVVPINQTSAPQEANGEVPCPVVYQGDPGIAFISPPPPLHVPPPQLGDSPSPHNAPMYTLTYPPPYSSPGLIQVYSPVAPGDGSCTPSDYSTPPPQPLPLPPPPPSTSTATATTMPLRPDSWDPNIQGGDAEAVKMNQGAPPYMMYPMPVMYGGHGGYGYNPQWGYGIPVMPTPTTMEEGKQATIMPGGDGYQQMIAVSNWGQGYVTDVPPHTVLCPPMPAQGYPPMLREPSPLPFAPAPFQQQQQQQHHHHQQQHHHQPEGREGGRDPRPFHPQHHHHPRGRGRGGSHHRGGHNPHHNTFRSQGHQGNFYHGGGGTQRSHPRHPRGGHPSGRGGPRHFPNNHVPPHIHQRAAYQYEGQPLMQIGTKKPNNSNDSLPPQGMSGGNAPPPQPAPPPPPPPSAVGPGVVASPPLVTFVDPERPPGVLPIPPPDASGVPPQEPMPVPPPPQGYYSPAPPGYVMSGQWMWKMM